MLQKCLDSGGLGPPVALYLGNEQKTISRVLFQRRELTEFCSKLGEFCEKLGEFAFCAHTHKKKKQAEQSSLSSFPGTQFGVFETVFGPLPNAHPIASSNRSMFFVYRAPRALSLYNPQKGPMTPLLPCTKEGGIAAQAALSKVLRYTPVSQL